MVSKELEQIRSQLTHKQHLYLTALISGKSEAEARKAADYNRPPKSPLLKKAIDLFHKHDFEATLTDRQKAIKFYSSKMKILDDLFDKINLKKIHLDPVNIIKEQRFLQTEINKLQGLYVEQEEEKQGITKEQEAAFNEDLDSCTD